ncbi:MAG: adenosylcobinamide amidohydrolase [Eubacteriales bacterium]|nr:adenosylcobinamide amidohydrolase [Eubacteriales bacterium]
MSNTVSRDYTLWEQSELSINQNGDRFESRAGALILHFSGPRRCLSSSPLNGGVTDVLTSAFNLNLQCFGRHSALSAETYEETLQLAATKLSLNPQNTTALATAAWLERAVVAEIEEGGIWLQAVMTGGIRQNAVNAGDPASYYESLEESENFYPCGTLNLLLSTNIKLSPGALCKALITATEAKTGCLRDLYLPSTVSPDYATGSGTDGTILISNLTGPELTDTSSHSLFGELLSKVVKLVLRRSLLINTGVCTAHFHNLETLLSRYGSGQLRLFELLKSKQPATAARALLHQFPSIAEKIESGEYTARGFCQLYKRIQFDSQAIVFTVLYLHLLDCHRHGLLEWGEIFREGFDLIYAILDCKNFELSEISGILTKPIEVDEFLEVLEMTLLILIFSEKD